MSSKKVWPDNEADQCNPCNRVKECNRQVPFNESDIKKQVGAEIARELTHSFFSPTCLLSEFEDNEDSPKQ